MACRASSRGKPAASCTAATSPAASSPRPSRSPPSPASPPNRPASWIWTGNGIPTFVKLDGALPGSFAREAGELGNCRPFRQLPNGVSWSSVRVNLLDLNGDGRDDLLVVTNTHYVGYSSLGAEGFGDPGLLR
ncbi:MAG: hypothetical protein R3B70_12595 [Polyangiaceae bacterium]